MKEKTQNLIRLTMNRIKREVIRENKGIGRNVSDKKWLNLLREDLQTRFNHGKIFTTESFSELFDSNGSVNEKNTKMYLDNYFSN